MKPFTAFIVLAFTFSLSFPHHSDGRIIPADDRMHADFPVDDRSEQRFTISTGEIPHAGPLSGDRFMHLRIHRPMNHHHGFGHGPFLMRSRRGCRHGISSIQSDGKPIMMPFVLRHGDGVRSRPLPAMDMKNWEPEREQEQQQQQPMKNWEPEREQEQQPQQPMKNWEPEREHEQQPQQPMKNWEPEREQEQEPEREQGMGVVKWFRDVVGRY